MSGQKATPPVRPSAKPAVASSGKQAYEARRAAQAGVSVEKWREARARARREELAEIEAARPKPVKPPGLIRRLMDRLHKPL